MFLVGNLFQDTTSKGAMASNKSTVVIASDTTTVGATIDKAGFRRLLFQIFTGTLTDGDYEWKMFAGEASNMSDEIEVTATEQNGDLPDWDADTDDDQFAKVEYTGVKRYVRLKVISTNFTSSGAVVGAIAMIAQPLSAPTQD